MLQQQPRSSSTTNNRTRTSSSNMSVYEPLGGTTNGTGDSRGGYRSSKGYDGTGSVSEDADTVSLRSSSTRGGLHHHLPELSEPLTASADPFFVFRDDLERKLERMDESLAEYLRLVNQVDTAENSSIIKESKKTLKRSIKNAEATLADVQMAVNLEQTKSNDDSHAASDHSLYERQSLVQTSRDRIERARLESNSASVKAKLLSDERAMRRRRGKRGDGNDRSASIASQEQHEDMIAGSQARASLLMQRQDETLDALDVAVTRVGDMAVAIGEEINDQNKMLDEMTEDLDNVEEELGIVMGKLAKFLKTKNSWQLGTILILMAVTVVLFFLVLYT